MATLPLAPGPLREATDWLETYRRFWDETLDRLTEHLRDLKQTGKGND